MGSVLSFGEIGFVKVFAKIASSSETHMINCDIFYDHVVYIRQQVTMDKLL